MENLLVENKLFKLSNEDKIQQVRHKLEFLDVDEKSYVFAVELQESRRFFTCTKDQLENLKPFTNIHEVAFTGKKLKLVADFDNINKYKVGKYLTLENILLTFCEFIKETDSERYEDLPAAYFWEIKDQIEKGEKINLKYFDKECLFFSDSSTHEKTSIHFVMREIVVFQNMKNQETFWRYFCKKFPEMPEPDWSLYCANHQLRCVYSSKIGENRFLKPVIFDESQTYEEFAWQEIENINFSDYLMTVLPDSEYFAINDPENPFVKLDHTSWEKKIPVEIPEIDPNTIEENKNKFVKLIDLVKIYKNDLLYVGSTGNRFATKIALYMRKYFGFKLTEEIHGKIFRPIFGKKYEYPEDFIKYEIPDFNSTLENLVQKLGLYFEFNLSGEVNFKKINEQYFSAEHISDDQRIQVFRAPCGSGKTEAVFKMISEKLKHNPGFKVCAITYRNELGIVFKNKARELFKDNTIITHGDLAGYTNPKEKLKKAAEAKIFAVSIESLHKYAGILSEFDLFLFDECESFFDEFWNVKKEQLKFTMHLNKMILQNKKCIFTDAFAGEATIRFINKIGEVPLNEINFVNNCYQKLADTTIKRVANYKKLGIELLRASIRGAFFFGSRKEAEKFETECISIFGAEKVFHIYGGQEKNISTLKINKEIVKKDLKVLIYTSAAESGMSITEPFDFTFIIPDKFSNTRRSLAQASQRARELKTKTIYVYYPAAKVEKEGKITKEIIKSFLEREVINSYKKTYTQCPREAKKAYEAKIGTLVNLCKREYSGWGCNLEINDNFTEFMAENFARNEIGRETLFRDFLADMQSYGAKYKNKCVETKLDDYEKKDINKRFADHSEKILEKQLGKLNGEPETERDEFTRNHLKNISLENVEILCKKTKLNPNKLAEKLVDQKKVKTFEDAFIRKRTFEFWWKSENPLVKKLEKTYGKFESIKIFAEIAEKIFMNTGQNGNLSEIFENLPNEPIEIPDSYQKMNIEPTYELIGKFHAIFSGKTLREKLEPKLRKFVKKNLKLFNESKVKSRGNIYKSIDELKFVDLVRFVNSTIGLAGYKLNCVRQESTKRKPELDIYAIDNELLI